MPAYRGGRWWLAAARGVRVERYRLTGAEWEALEAAGWEFLVEHAAGNDGNYRPA